MPYSVLCTADLCQERFKMNRRDFCKLSAGAAVAGILGNTLKIKPSFAQTPEKTKASDTEQQTDSEKDKPIVYFSREITPESLLKLYAKINQNITGKTALKLHTGEPNGPNLLPRELAKALQAQIPDSTIVECNVLYDSPRQNTEGHLETLKINGWTFCPVDIMDADGDVNLPIIGGKHLKEVAVGKNIKNYESMVVYTHFKGHAMGGFGGSLKNIAIGCASGKTGKAQLHGEGWPIGKEFLERMVEGGKAVCDHFGKKITYINVLKNISVDCDCDAHGAKPTCPDIGILASADILAIDQACIDLVYALPEKDNHDIVERIESREGLHQLEYMDELKMGSRKYTLIEV